jgi:DNA replication licensing factor MCM5
MSLTRCARRYVSLPLLLSLSLSHTHTHTLPHTHTLILTLLHTDAQDRVAIHEAMEQQTISIAKAGITTILNSRTSVLAAANPIFGRYDDMKSPTENIDFQTTILSRFDLIFIIKDIQDTNKDTMLAKHIINVHKKRDQAVREAAGGDEGLFDIDVLKKYVAYCRNTIHPRLSAEAAEVLKNQYISIRSQMHQRATDLGQSNQASAIPITVRQLEAIIRISESLARMEMSHIANVNHVNEAIRLFKVSTFQAATTTTGDVSGSAGFMKQVQRAERHLKSRIAIGNMLQRSRLRDELVVAQHDENAVLKAIQVMIQRGELQEINRGKMLKRLK